MQRNRVNSSLTEISNQEHWWARGGYKAITITVSVLCGFWLLFGLFGSSNSYETPAAEETLGGYTNATQTISGFGDTPTVTLPISTNCDLAAVEQAVTAISAAVFTGDWSTVAIAAGFDTPTVSSPASLKEITAIDHNSTCGDTDVNLVFTHEGSDHSFTQPIQVFLEESVWVYQPEA